ncbi:MAG TPA: Rne/Rng family ribonuclease [Micrococcaceae bacterium]|nr:Rne/Rng family ribonuclease [Micrococcaceae bacterium]
MDNDKLFPEATAATNEERLPLATEPDVEPKKAPRVRRKASTPAGEPASSPVSPENIGAESMSAGDRSAEDASPADTQHDAAQVQLPLLEAATATAKVPARRLRAKKAQANDADGEPGNEIDTVRVPAAEAGATSDAAGTEVPTTSEAPLAKRAPRRRASAKTTSPATAEPAPTTGAGASTVPAGAAESITSTGPAVVEPVGGTAETTSQPTAGATVSAEPPARRRRASRSTATRTAIGDRATGDAATETATGVAATETATGVAATETATGDAATDTATGNTATATAATDTARGGADAETTGDTSTDTATAASSEAAGSEAAGQAQSGTQATAQEPNQAPVQAPSPFQPTSPVSVLFQAPDLSAVVAPTPAPAASDEDTDEDTEAGEGGRRRRRSRSRRPRNGGEGNGGDQTEEGEEDSAGNAPEGDGVTSRRRRRRRRGDQDLELDGGNDDDPPNTVTRVRAPRLHTEAPVSNKVTSLRGSTRLEAKKQRRRESRETGRRRQVITEAEFLARRESVDRTMVVRQRDERIQIGVLEDGILAEHFVSKTQQDSLIGNVYLGKVQNVLPSMEAAFVDIGRGRNAVLYAGEVNWDAAHLDGAPRRIENALKSGDSVLVQVTKDPVGHKGARLTSQVSLPGRYLVYVPGGSMTGISRKLPDVERNRLKRILKDHLPESAGVIVRTAAEGASEEELTHDINRLRAQWEGIESRATSTKTLAPEMLYGEPDLTIKVVRDVFNEDFSKLIVSGEEAWDTIEAYVTYVAPDLVDRLEKWTKDEDIFAVHRIDEQISKALERKVFLPSGGSLVIDRTEAMTVVDVNTGKFTGSGGNLEETVTKNNLEAAEEVVRQLRLRDIGGIIVIDFIDMVLESNRDLVLRRLVECLGRDRTKHQVAEVTSLGLIQMTRKRMGTGLLEVFGEQCEHCAGRGVVTHDVPVEHRRAHTIAAEQHHPQPRSDSSRPEQQRSPRNEKKRNRNRPQGAEHETGEHHGHDELSEAERHAKAEAARAALATIAAATHASHHDDGHAAAQGGNGHAGAGNAEPGTVPEAGHPAAATGAPAAAAPAAPAASGMVAPAVPAEQSGAKGDGGHGPADGNHGGRGPVLTIGGEAIELPRGDHHVPDHPADPARALAGLAQALDQLSEGQAPEGRTAAGHAADSGDHSGLDSEGVPLRSRSRRGRRNRSASRAQGAANTNEVQQRSAEPARNAPQPEPTSSGQDQAASAGGNIPAKPKQAPKSGKPSAEPIILGVGVPASDL